MSTDSSAPPYSATHRDIETEINLIDLWRVAWNRRYFIAIFTSFIALASVIYAISLENVYRAEALLSPVSSNNEGRNVQLGFAASLAGLNIEPSGSDIETTLATLRSREFILKFIADRDLLVWLAASAYNAEAGESLLLQEIYDAEVGSWTMRDGKSLKPTDWEAYELFSSILSVSEDSSTGLIQVAIDWPDPRLAANWVNWIIEDINAHTKTRDMEEASRAVEYLQRQLSNTQLVEMQRVLYELIESQTRTLMLGDVRDEYVLEVIDPAFIPEDKVYPNRMFICILGALFGAMTATLIVLVQHAIRAINSEANR